MGEIGISRDLDCLNIVCLPPWCVDKSEAKLIKFYLEHILYKLSNLCQYACVPASQANVEKVIYLQAANISAFPILASSAAAEQS